MHLGKSRIFLFFCLAFILGVFLGRYLRPINLSSTSIGDQHATVIALSAMTFVFLITIFWRKPWPMLVGFLGLTLLLGSWRYLASFPNNTPNFIGKLYDQKVELEGLVVREPDVRSNRTNLTVSSKLITNNNNYNKLVGNILLNVGRYPEYQYGDRLKISGKIEEPFVSEEFSYKDYLARYDTYAVIRFPKIEKLAEGEGNIIKATLLKFKSRILRGLTSTLPEPHNSLLLGIILGLKKALPPDLSEALVVAGVSHIVVISGFNISILTKTILGARQWVGRKITFIAALLVVLAFVIMTGAEASVIRAAVMGSMLVLAMGLRRLYQSPNAIIFAATIMVFLNPKILQFDVGFQLSFLATIGIFYLCPIFEKWFQKLPTLLNLRQNFAATLAALLFTLPVLIINFGQMSLVAILSNVLILWVVIYIMYVGIPVGLLGTIYAPLVEIFAWLLWAMLQYVIWVVEFFSRLPLAAVAAPMPIWSLVIYYVLLVLWLLWYRKTREFNYYLEYIIQKM